MRSQQGTIWTVEVKMMDYGFPSRQQNLAFPERLFGMMLKDLPIGDMRLARLCNCTDNFPFKGSFA
jgi:hypothetical protein